VTTDLKSKTQLVHQNKTRDKRSLTLRHYTHQRERERAHSGMSSAFPLGKEIFALIIYEKKKPITYKF